MNAAVSCRSFCWVPEPCALMYDTSAGSSRAWSQRGADGLGHLHARPGAARSCGRRCCGWRSRRPRSRRARRARRACSASSRTSTAAPSPRTKPSRSASNGREACSGSSLSGRGRLDRVEAGDRDRGDRRVGGPGDHDVGLAVGDRAGGRSRSRRCRRCSRWRRPGPGRAGRAGRPPRRRGCSAPAPGTGTARRSAWSTSQSPAAVADPDVLLLQRHGAADGAAEHHPGALRVGVGRGSSPLSASASRGAGQRELHVPVGAPPLGRG